MLHPQWVFANRAARDLRLTPFNFHVPDSAKPDPRTLKRFQFHKTVLEAAGIKNLSSLGKLMIPTGPVVPSVGIMKPARNVVARDSILFQNAYRIQDAGILQPISGVAQVLKGKRLPRLSLEPSTISTSPVVTAFHDSDLIHHPSLSQPPDILVPQRSRMASERSGKGKALISAMNINVAYWAASWIDIPDDTQIIIKYPNKFLFIITERLTVGRNVTFTWDREDYGAAGIPTVFKDPPAKPQAFESETLSGITGERGGNGRHGEPGPEGRDAPEMELWVLETDGQPFFDLKGQDGYEGGKGQDGGAGGDGWKGRAAIPIYIGSVLVDCKSGPGNGGNGGPGGDGGDGGPGGSGGHGGRLSIYAPQDVLIAWASNYFVNLEGGAGGPGGILGMPGNGGEGGKVGDNPANCRSSEPRTDGTRGANGNPGRPGSEGFSGERYHDDMELMHVITPDMFEEQQIAPALITLSPQAAIEGDTVTATGLRLTGASVVFVAGRPCVPTVVSETELTFAVPAVSGGQQPVQVSLVDGAKSNRATLNVLCGIESVEPVGRLRPGTRVSLKGSGFAPGSRVRGNGESMPDVVYVDSHRLDFLLRRPATVIPNRAGEKVSLDVVLPKGEVSNTVDVVLDTFRIVVMGDSVMWGQGLQENHKMHSLVADAIRNRQGNIGLYVDNLAHSGATIGEGDRTILPQLAGEVPTSYPTIIQQCDGFSDAPETVDLVLVNGGINDVNVRRILNTTVPDEELLDGFEKYCHQHMRGLLDRIATKFQNARIIVTGYYPFLSEDSNLGLVQAFLVVLGVAVAQIFGGVAGAVVGPILLADLAKRCRLFVEHSEIQLQAAVDEINESLINNNGGVRRIFLAQPEFGRENAALASDPWIFGINIDLSPQDPAIAPGRAAACMAAGSNRTDIEQCKKASIGHPNVRGAQEFAREIISFLYPASFPSSFLWGVATSGYQVEGGIENNDWHIFTTTPAIHDRVHNLSTLVGLNIDLQPAGEAIRHANLDVLIEDLERAKFLGMNAYRFSIEWSLVEPVQSGSTDPDAFQYYDAAITEMHKRGLKPIVTLNHLTLPSWVLTPPADPGKWFTDDGFLNSMRGWENPATVDAFNTFVTEVVSRYATRVDTWITLNEPVGSMIGVGYIGGVWPPGFVLDGARAKIAYFNLLKAHVKAYDTIKQIYGSLPSRVGIAHAMLYPKLTQAGGGIGNVNEAAKNQFNYFYNEHLLNSLIKEEIDVAIHRRLDNQVRISSQQFYNLPLDQPWKPRLDFVGLNYYRSVYLYYDQIVAIAAGFSGAAFDNHLIDDEEGHALVNDMGWEIYPKGLYHLLTLLHVKYDLPILITENGMPQLVDRNRAPFIVAHLAQVLRAIQEGVSVDGYIHWTLADNFEWQDHFQPTARFGLFAVDRDKTDEVGNKLLLRHMTEGALALKYIIAENGMGEAVERFGIITPRAYGVSPPSKSDGILWNLERDNGESFTLYVSWLSGKAKLCGGLFIQNTHHWYDLQDVQRDGGGLTITILLRDGTRSTAKAQINGMDLQVEFDRGPLMGAWQGKRIALHGSWKSEVAFPKYVSLRWIEGPFEPWRGKFMSVQPRRQWIMLDPARLQVDQVEFGIQGYGDFQGTLLQSPDRLIGEIRVYGASPGTGTVWRARRLRDDIPI